MGGLGRPFFCCVSDVAAAAQFQNYKLAGPILKEEEVTGVAGVTGVQNGPCAVVIFEIEQQRATSDAGRPW